MTVEDRESEDGGGAAQGPSVSQADNLVLTFISHPVRSTLTTSPCWLILTVPGNHHLRAR